MTGAIVYVPLLARDLGLSHSQIGLLVASYQSTLLASNMLFGRWADFGDRKRFIVAGLLLSAMTVAGHTLVRSIPGLFVIRALAGFCLGVYPAALVAYFYRHDGRLGRYSGYGALGWALGATVAGVVASGWVFPVSTALMGAAVVIAFVGLRSQREHFDHPFIDLRVLKRNWRLYVSFLLRHLGAFSIWTIFPVYIADLGASRLWVGLLWAINPLGQFVFMNLFERLSEGLLIRGGFVLSVLTFAAYGFASDWRQLVPIQIVLALSWSCLYLGSIKQLMRLNREHSTAAGMLGSMLSLAAVAGALLEGVTGRFGYRTVMFAAVGFAVAGGMLFGWRDKN